MVVKVVRLLRGRTWLVEIDGLPGDTLEVASKSFKGFAPDEEGVDDAPG